MSKNNDFLDTFFNLILLKYAFPWIVIIVLIFIGAFNFNQWKATLGYDKDEILLYLNLKSDIYNIAQKRLNEKEFILESYEESATDYDYVNLKYIPINKSYTAEQYDYLLKAEITKIYNDIKDKILINNTLNDDENFLENKIIRIYFDSYSFSVDLVYSLENKWEKSYLEILEQPIITQEALNNYKF